MGRKLRRDGIFFVSGGKRRYMKETTCPHCGKLFLAYYSRFCSRRCGTLSHPAPNKGKKIPSMTGPKNHNWKGGKRKHSAGYIEIRGRNHYILEHRLVVEKEIGRFLNPREVVHHINGIKDDNRVSNLIAFKSETYHRFFERGKSVPSEFIVFDGRKI